MPRRARSADRARSVLDGVLPRPGANRLATAATATAAAPVSRAGPIAPSYPVGVSSPPLPRKTATSTAMPSATPNSRIVELAELAIAKSSSGSPSSTIDAPGANVSPMPTPAMSSGTMKDE